MEETIEKEIETASNIIIYRIWKGNQYWVYYIHTNTGEQFCLFKLTAKSTSTSETWLLNKSKAKFNIQTGKKTITFYCLL